MTEVFELFQGNSTYYHTDYMYIRGGGYPHSPRERDPALAFSQKKSSPTAGLVKVNYANKKRKKKEEKKGKKKKSIVAWCYCIM